MREGTGKPGEYPKRTIWHIEGKEIIRGSFTSLPFAQSLRQAHPPEADSKYPMYSRGESRTKTAQSLKRKAFAGSSVNFSLFPSQRLESVPSSMVSQRA